MNGLTLLSLIALVLGVLVAYRFGRAHGGRRTLEDDRAAIPSSLPMTPAPVHAAPTVVPPVDAAVLADEYARLVRSYEAEGYSLRRSLDDLQAQCNRRVDEAGAHADMLNGEIERLRGETARYRQVIVDIENNAPPPLLDSPDAPDDLRLIVGIGPVLERLLQQLGVATYRQIARWSERDIDDFDAKLPEFPGRIRRDDWVTQARELHVSKYGERP
jgi:predicted flap endonuclease-1-like 5' DNA nuclease